MSILGEGGNAEAERLGGVAIDQGRRDGYESRKDSYNGADEEVAAE